MSESKNTGDFGRWSIEADPPDTIEGTVTCFKLKYAYSVLHEDLSYADLSDLMDCLKDADAKYKLT